MSKTGNHGSLERLAVGVENNYKLGKARRQPEGAGLKARAGWPRLVKLEAPRLGVREGLQVWEARGQRVWVGVLRRWAVARTWKKLEGAGSVDEAGWRRSGSGERG